MPYSIAVRGRYADRCMPRSLRLFQFAIATSLMVCTLLFLVWSIRWPLVGDASLLHYIGFLIEHGMAPYRVVNDVDMPGAFLIEIAMMHIFGPGALALRVFDFTLLAVAAVSFAILTRRSGWFPAVFAATMFALVHGRDGLEQAGQRDLTMAVLLVSGTAALMIAVRHRSIAAMGLFGLVAGVALSIKPTAIPLSLAELLIAAHALRKQGVRLSKPLTAAGCCAVLFPTVAAAFVVQQHAAGALWADLHGVIPYYASLGHRPFSFLLTHSVSPVMALVLVWFAVIALTRPPVDWERAMLLTGVGFGLLSYFLQARGFPYHRYPLLAFLLPTMALDFTDALARLRSTHPPQKIAAGLAVTALAVGGFFLGPQSAVLVHRYRWWETDFNTTLEQNLNRLGGGRLSGHVQCIDSVSGCSTSLYNLRLLPATGILLDFPLFGIASQPAVQQARADFRHKVFEHPPQVIIVTSPLHIDGPGDFRKLALWPELPGFLARSYSLDTDWHPTRTRRWWSREELGPSYRIYVLKAEPAN